MKNYREKARELIKGAVDIHIHTAPDIFPRKINDIEAAEQAKKAGMKAIVIKSHVTETASRASIASEITGFPVYGGVSLNYALGGLNDHAVEVAAKLGAKFVWMPTLDAAWYLQHSEHVSALAGSLSREVEELSLLDPNNDLNPAIFPILEAIARWNLILSTGHISKTEAELLVGRAKDAGVERIVLTHATADFLDYRVEDLQRLSTLGVWVELDWFFATRLAKNPCSPGAFAGVIRAVGADKVILGTDGGQFGNPPPVEMLVEFITNLLGLGITEEEIRMMTSVNPSKLMKI
ncbi:hypothetical protein IT084_16070 [Desulfallas sp. Bu1-1]|uniref:DUF6282 family protein n=1 Tax=Desulfallas sp. Bu1-1 TaxID=2787620 RepID=UPI00189F9BF2|nr:DUF6282 family protein [Desulfallas sp. Bu1-1]MBF7084468.1 hypothetical protein [Desulfallas sp. Bu1-1]